MASASLERAVQHVEQAWIPVNPRALEDVRTKLSAGVYETTPECLYSDLKQDLALFLFTLKRLSEFVRSNEPQFVHLRHLTDGKTPREIIDACTPDLLIKVFETSKEKVSIHRFEETSEAQAERLRATLVSAATSELLSKEEHMDSDLGFSTALLRQLGLTLISWNYPKIYARALDSLSEADSLDGILHRLLGFSPLMLGVQIARRWKLSPKILRGMGEKPDRRKLDGPLPTDDEGAHLEQICRIGEALARASNPELYPSAEADWTTAEQAIKERLGPDGVEAVLSHAAVLSKGYSNELKQFPLIRPEVSPESVIAATSNLRSWAERNPYLRGCPEVIRKELTLLYGSLSEGRIEREQIRNLMFKIVPLAGFQEGVIFTFDPERKVLAPVLTLGKPEASRVLPIRTNSVIAQGDLVVAAFSCRSPLREEKTAEDATRQVALAGVLGSEAPFGVFYLSAQGQTKNNDEMSLFRALRRALEDCLGIE